jgi:hypothetical protein
LAAAEMAIVSMRVLRLTGLGHIGLGLIGFMMAATMSDLAAATSANFERNAYWPGLSLPIERNLRWLIQNETRGKSAPQKPTQELQTLKDIYAAMRRCYVPPSLDQARPGMRITVQFAFTRDGELFGKPRILYETPGASPEQQSAYRMAVAVALARCSPLPFSKSLGNAVAGRVFAIQFVDERNIRGAELNPWPIPTIR